MNLHHAKKAILALFMSLFCLTILAQGHARTISGVVVDKSGEGLIGANVLVKGTSNGTITDLNGAFTLSNVTNQSVLIISYVGYLTQDITVGSQSTIKITLLEADKTLDEVVVVGYGTMKKRDLTGSVASVNGNEISSVPVANVAQALQGKLPGVNVTTQDGRPGAEVSILVRGGGSISQSNDPLIFIDGVEGSLSDIPSDQIQSIDVLKDASSTAIYGSRGANGVILVTTKSAKEGKTKITYNGYLKYNTPTKYLEALNPYDYLSYVWANAAANGDAYREPFEKLFGLGTYTSLNSGGINSYKGMATDDIQRDVYNSSLSTNHDLTVSGGGENTKVLFSVNYMDDEGMKLNSYAKRMNVSFKLDQKISNTVKFNLDTRYTDKQQMDDESTTSGSGSILSSAYRFRPIATNHILGDLTQLNEGNIDQYGKNCMWDTYSPAERIADYEPLTLEQVLRTSGSLNWEIIKGLNYHTDLALKRDWGQKKYWAGAVYNDYLDDVTGEKLYAGSVDYLKSDGWSLRWTNTLTYDFNITDAQHLNLMVGHEVSNTGGTYLRVQADHFPSNFTKDNAFGMINEYDRDKGSASFSSDIDIPTRFLSYFGRANYSLLDRYLFTFTFRADQASSFAPEHRIGYFPAGAVAWRMSEERFMKQYAWLDNLKLRLSYGSVGNANIEQGLWMQSWTSVKDYRWEYNLDHIYQSAYDLSSSSMANKDLKWETTITRDFGVDYGFFNNRLFGTVDLYWNTTKDLLMETTIPGITGFTTTFANVGQTSNKGVEVSLNGVVYKSRDWKITLSGNINFNKNNVDALADNVTGLYGTNWASSSTYPAKDYILKVGSPVGVVRGFVYDGFYTVKDFDYSNGVYTLKQGVPDVGSFIGVVHGVGSSERPEGQVAYPGVIKYKDLNNDGKIDDKDLTDIGRMTPIHTGGFNIDATYKNFDFSMFFNWSYGNDIYNVNKLGSLYGYKESGVYENKLSIVKNSYKIYNIVDGQLVRLSTPEELSAANVNATLPLLYNENCATSSIAIEDGSYLRLNTLTFGYTLPKELTQKVRVENARLYGSIYNVFTLTKYSGLDPEVNTNTSQNHSIYPTVGLDWGTYPRARSFVFGVNVSF